jgi:hypothetical protein
VKELCELHVRKRNAPPGNRTSVLKFGSSSLTDSWPIYTCVSYSVSLSFSFVHCSMLSHFYILYHRCDVSEKYLPGMELWSSSSLPVALLIHDSFIHFYHFLFFITLSLFFLSQGRDIREKYLPRIELQSCISRPVSLLIHDPFTLFYSL